MFGWVKHSGGLIKIYRVLGHGTTIYLYLPRAKGQAEADAMHLRAEAYQAYSQAAVLDKMLSNLPDLARAFSESLASVDKVTIVSTGDGTAGVSAYTGEVARMVAQVPELVESLTGLKLNELLERLTTVGVTTSTGPNGGAPLVSER